MRFVQGACPAKVCGHRIEPSGAPFGLEQRLDIFPQLLLVPFYRPHVISTALHYLYRQMPLRQYGVAPHHFAPQIQTLQHPHCRANLILHTRHFDLHHHPAFATHIRR